jgi:hypothetical protein
MAVACTAIIHDHANTYIFSDLMRIQKDHLEAVTMLLALPKQSNHQFDYNNSRPRHADDIATPSLKEKLSPAFVEHL